MDTSPGHNPKQASQAEPTIEEVKEWDEDELLKWIRQKRPRLLKGDNLKKFKAADISGEAFLTGAGNDGFFKNECNLSIRPSLALANLAREIAGGEIAGKKRNRQYSRDTETSNTASKKPRPESEANGQLQKLATSARQQRELIRQVIKGLDQPSVSLSKDVDLLPNSVLQLSNPTFDTKLPFPFVGYAVPDRFQVNSKDNEKNWFYMGREKFAEIRDRFEQICKDPKRTDLIIYGTRGYGKSHLLAALVCYWAAMDQKVIYIPNCWDFIKDPVRYMISAILFAWADDKSQQQEIMALETQEDIYRFFQAQAQEDVTFVIDQFNALEKEKNDNEYNPSEKPQLLDWVYRLTARHKAIYSSSANNYSTLNKRPKQSNSEIMYVYGGLTRKEMDHWWARRQDVELGDYTKNEVEDWTGCIPWFLEKCIVDGTIDLTAKFLAEIWEQASTFEQEIQTQYKNELDTLLKHYEYMNACLFSLPVRLSSKDIPGLVDHRYFYDKYDSKLGKLMGHYTCGLCRNAVSPMLLENRVRFSKDLFGRIGVRDNIFAPTLSY